MNTLLKRDDVPSHLFNISELDLSNDLFASPLSDQWVRLGARTILSRRDERDVEDVTERQSLLLPFSHFVDIFEKLEYVGNVIGDLGKPEGSIFDNGENKQYRYAAFHEFNFPFSSTVAEPLVFFHPTNRDLLVNPDLWLFLELDEKQPNCGMWWDPRRGIEALRYRMIDGDNLRIVEIRTDYLLKYLQARQLSLIIGHYRHLNLYLPSSSAVGLFVEGNVSLGTPKQSAKAVIENWHRTGFGNPFLQRRLHLWFQIGPPEIDVEDPWTEQPSFDPYTFTLPTNVGLVAPARWRHFKADSARTFEGTKCDFMNRVFFRQEVLTKYEGASGFDIADDGSVTCQSFWGLNRSTSRLGNELLSTAIGDFAEGLPFEEWPHWKQYAVEPPSPDFAATFDSEPTVAAAVDSVVQALNELNTAFADLAISLGVSEPSLLWGGSLDSLAGRQLKWVYPVSASDDEFLKRATLASTLVIDELKPKSLRELLGRIDRQLYQNDETPPRPLGSRNLLQRAMLIAALLEEFKSDIPAIPMLVAQAEGKLTADEPDSQLELSALYQRVRDGFAPIAFLYDLRTHGGLAHPPNKPKAGEAAARLGLSEQDWHRSDYLRLLKLVSESFRQISQTLWKATEALTG